MSIRELDRFVLSFASILYKLENICELPKLIIRRVVNTKRLSWNFFFLLIFVTIPDQNNFSI